MIELNLAECHFENAPKQAKYSAEANTDPATTEKLTKAHKHCTLVKYRHSMISATREAGRAQCPDSKADFHNATFLATTIKHLTNKKPETKTNKKNQTTAALPNQWPH